MDSSKGLHMFERMQVPVLGVIENMSYFRAPDTGTVYDIFGSGGARKAAEANDIECLGQLPIQISLREGSDKGRPVTVSEPDSEAATLFRQIAQRTAAKLSIQAAQVQSVV
jgi:ATP-binding protein involved in chromosome partitioning